jgi:hypothetical protein
MVFYVSVCLTVHQQYLLSRRTLETALVKCMVTLSKKEENRVFEVIDRVLKQVFGEEAACLMYQYLERRYSWSQRAFLEKIDAFSKGMEEFLSSGAYMVENKILDTIYSSQDALREAKVDSFEERDFASQIRLAMQKA